jgi:hypothetical protein
MSLGSQRVKLSPTINESNSYLQTTLLESPVLIDPTSLASSVLSSTSLFEKKANKCRYSYCK